MQLRIEQRSLHLSSLYLAKNNFINSASNKQLNNISLLVLFVTNSPWDESSGDEASGNETSVYKPK